MSRPVRVPEHQEYLTAMGKRIRNARLASGLSQHAVAKKMGVQHGTLQAWETGLYEAKPWLLSKYAQALGIPVGVLFGESEVPVGLGKEAALIEKITTRLKHELAKLVLEDVNLRQLLVVQHMNDTLDRVAEDMLDE